MKTVILEIRKFDAVLDDVAIACKAGKSTSPRISFETVESLWKTISPKKMEILQTMAGAGALGVREIARRVARDVRAVHRDLQALKMAGIVQKTADGKQVFPYDKIHVDFTLSGAA
jgi:predicted transcriptional regulator